MTSSANIVRLFIAIQRLAAIGADDQAAGARLSISPRGSREATVSGEPATSQPISTSSSKVSSDSGLLR
ncbi:MAG: hypothetical protein R2736_22950 [Solirubrobacterales bacterium]